MDRAAYSQLAILKTNSLFLSLHDRSRDDPLQYSHFIGWYIVNLQCTAVRYKYNFVWVVIYSNKVEMKVMMKYIMFVMVMHKLKMH